MKSKQQTKKGRELRIIIGVDAYKKNKNDYCGKIGKIEYCDRCCNAPRVQFIGIANNELLENFNLDRCRFFIA